jgi:arylsulfatase A-like enzyme
MIIAGPGIRHGADSHLVLNIDLAPTILELAEIPVPQNMHGSSLLPLLKNKKPKWREDFLYEAPTPTLGSRPLLALRTQRYKLIQTFDDSELSQVVFEELYDLEREPKETKNLDDIPDYSNILQRLRGRLKRARSAVKSV